MERLFRDSKNPFLRKGVAAGYLAVKNVRRTLAPASFGDRPAVLVNSFPKSGTHLLSQIIGGLPEHYDWGQFYVSSPTLTMREVPTGVMTNRLRRVCPSEIVKAHLFWHPDFAHALDERKVVRYFIYRDPRDVVVSETRYLTSMNRRHRLHREYASIDNDRDRLSLCINGSDALLRQGVWYPNIAERFARYRGWLSDQPTMSMRYEDLRGERMAAVVEELVDHYLSSASPVTPAEKTAIRDECLARINPGRSHTFRAGRPGSWVDSFDDQLKDEFKAVAGRLLVELGYEADEAW